MDKVIIEAAGMFAILIGILILVLAMIEIKSRHDDEEWHRIFKRKDRDDD